MKIITDKVYYMLLSIQNAGLTVKRLIFKIQEFVYGEQHIKYVIRYWKNIHFKFRKPL